MHRDLGTAGEIDGVVTEHVRLSLLRLLVQAQQPQAPEGLERELRNLIEQIDGLQLAFDVSRRQIMLPLEPVNVSEVAESVIHKIRKNISSYGININLNKIQKNPVLAHRAALARSLESMIHTALNSSDLISTKSIDVSAIKSAEGVKLGVYSDSFSLNVKEYKVAKNKISNTSRPVASLNPGIAAHLYVADSLLVAMGAKFRTAIHNNRHGIATILPYSSQLKLLNL